VELSPETCRVKPLRRINAIVASCWIYFTTKMFWIKLLGRIFGTKTAYVNGGWRNSEALQFVDPMMIE